MQIKQFKCRASKGGDLMTNGRGKDTMGQTTITMLQEWLISELTGKQKEVESKYFAHGNYAEHLALERMSKYYGQNFEKNELYLEDDYFQGTFDSRSEQLVIDVKCPWEAHTMPYFDEQPPKGYYNQLQIYMALTGLKKASLAYCLENHSEDEIDSLAQKIAWQKGKDEPDMEEWDEAKDRLTYDTLPEWMRVKVYEFDRDDALIETMQKRVIECREVIKNDLLPIFEELKNK